jgi:hypothetical protein
LPLPLPIPAQPATLTATRVATKATRIFFIGTPCVSVWSPITELIIRAWGGFALVLKSHSGYQSVWRCRSTRQTHAAVPKSGWETAQGKRGSALPLGGNNAIWLLNRATCSATSVRARARSQRLRHAERAMRVAEMSQRSGLLPPSANPGRSAAAHILQPPHPGRVVLDQGPLIRHRERFYRPIRYTPVPENPERRWSHAVSPRSH